MLFVLPVRAPIRVTGEDVGIEMADAAGRRADGRERGKSQQKMLEGHIGALRNRAIDNKALCWKFALARQAGSRKLKSRECGRDWIR